MKMIQKKKIQTKNKTSWGIKMNEGRKVEQGWWALLLYIFIKVEEKKRRKDYHHHLHHHQKPSERERERERERNHPLISFKLSWLLSILDLIYF